jgi:rfaE bifunctional protein nucleotidyltransferase chain/domain
MSKITIGKYFPDPEELIEKRLQWQKAKKKVVFTNGVFDILHKGHLHYLREAREYGDILIVGLNSDASVKRIKGAHRPINDQELRVTMLTFLRPVDAVVLFDDDTPIKLIEALEPDILVKGADYKAEEVVGADYVIKRGGEVKLAQFIQGLSTSSLIEEVKKSLQQE